MVEQNLREEIVAVQCTGTDTGENIESRDGKSSVAMTIVTSGMQFKLDTVVDTNRQALELAAKLELALSLLSITETKLEAAMVQIGQLQERLRQAESRG